MRDATTSPAEPVRGRSRIAALLKRMLRLTVLGAVLTICYVWATPHFYPRAGVPGFAHGLLHGAIMPMALPALVVGQDVTIYAEPNRGRPYKLGYTIGINLCGLIVFGTAFGFPKRQRAETGG